MQEQECKCELDGFQGAVWTGDCPLHGNKPMTNNNWIEEFDDWYYSFAIELKKDRPDGMQIKDKFKDFISNLLTKKDQEHKAELESIKGEIEKMIVNTPEKVFELNKDLPSTIAEQAYFESIGYCNAIKDALSVIEIKIIDHRQI